MCEYDINSEKCKNCTNQLECSYACLTSMNETLKNRHKNMERQVKKDVKAFSEEKQSRRNK